MYVYDYYLEIVSLLLIYDIRSLTTDSTLTKNGLQTNLVRVGQHLGPISWKYYGRKIATGVDRRFKIDQKFTTITWSVKSVENKYADMWFCL